LLVALVSFFSVCLFFIKNKQLNKKKISSRVEKNKYMFFSTHERIYKNITNIAVGIYDIFILSKYHI